VLVLLGVGFLAGLITALSPCVLPVLPIVLAGGASGGRRRPYAIVAGLVASFTVFTLAASALLDALGLPQDFLRNLAIALLFVVAATLVSTRFAHLLERPFYVLTRRRPTDAAGGFVLGLSLGLVFVPCAGPVLAAVSVLAANREVGGEAIALTLAYALGAAVPLLAIAIGGQRVSAPLRARTAWLRPVLGGLVAVTALAIALDADRRFQTSVPGYLDAFQERIERGNAAERELGRLTGVRGATGESERRLADYGPAPEFREIGGWLNTAGERPLTLEELRGRVVLIDFWTYSCINCLRTLPYLKAWDDAYRADGLTIVGVHTPEFAFEREPGNVRDAVRALGLRYPIALDPDYGTWNAWGNRYWPAKYFVDRRGRLRFAHFGEGEYARSEQVIRELLAEDGAEPPARMASVRGADQASGAALTPETYLGYERLDRERQYAGSDLAPDRVARYRFQTSPLGPSQFAYEGPWRVEGERIVASGIGANLRLRFQARDVHLVLGGRGVVEVRLDGRRRRSVRVRGDRLYTLLRLPEPRDGLLELRFSPDVEAYAFTFG
jgi:cytochrome c biogenesis protein CcdA/thiol-disulfide isomerase/thioredoxin